MKEKIKHMVNHFQALWQEEFTLNEITPIAHHIIAP